MLNPFLLVFLNYQQSIFLSGSQVYERDIEVVLTRVKDNEVDAVIVVADGPSVRCYNVV